MQNSEHVKNIAVIFAGGTGRRMHTVAKPKQFLELNGKPVIIYTLELFDEHPQIDGIVVVCLKDWIPYLEKQLRKFGVTKIGAVVPGGETGQESIYNGLIAAREVYGPACNVLIHDGVRPLITRQTISDNIEGVNKHGNCITCVPATETIVVKHDDGSLEIPSRADSIIVRAPQTFRLTDILEAHERARSEGRKDFIDSCTMMSQYGHRIHTIMGPVENIKITTPTDFFVFRTLVAVHENQQIFGF
ncbi:MAG: 2-C-methyl-D-erythritol 4-phosphate cytidylyltransferase [Muribaculaceae bacterium]|nr:2-C-methyl-D-erythritol 4-phosphate cytidylyltransferase [Muribaculaceae bacterium]